MVDHRVQNHQVPLDWNGVRLFHRPRDKEVRALDQEYSQVRVGFGSTVAGV